MKRRRPCSWSSETVSTERQRRRPSRATLLTALLALLHVTTTASWTCAAFESSSPRLERSPVTSIRSQCEVPLRAAARDSDNDKDPTDVSARLLEETHRRMEQQQRQIHQLLKLIHHQQKTSTQQQPSHDTSHDTSTASVVATNRSALARSNRIMLFIDGTWLYYSVYERESENCPFVRELGLAWPLRYRIDWTRLPQILLQQLQKSQHCTSDAEIVRSNVFTSYKADTSQQSLRYKLFQDLKHAGYNVSMMETVGNSEKCVDIQLAVEMMYYSTIPDAYDTALLLTGDKDFMPCMIRIRQQGRKLGLVSMRRGCNRALVDTPGVADFDVIWLDDHVRDLVVPLDADPTSKSALGISVFSLSKLLYDFVELSGLQRVSSRDVGRYLKFLQLDGISISEDLKRSFGGLKQFLSMSEIFLLQNREDSSIKEDRTDRAYWIELRPNAQQKLLELAKATTFSAAEKTFFDRYSLKPLEDNKQSAFYHSYLIQQAEWRRTTERNRGRPIGGNLLADEPSRDYSSRTVAELKALCRERGLKVSGVKSALLERIEQDDVDKAEVSQAQQPQRTDEPEEPGERDDDWAAMIPEKKRTYLKDLVVEYVRARGGKASSRDVGRYLAANKPSTVGNEDSNRHGQRDSALQELKSSFGNLGRFVHCCPEELETSDDVFGERNKFAFLIRLKKQRTATDGT